MITKVALDRLSRSLHSGVCDSDGYCNAVVHSTISGSGGRRARASSNGFPLDCLMRYRETVTRMILMAKLSILAEGAIALLVTLSGSALFAS